MVSITIAVILTCAIMLSLSESGKGVNDMRLGKRSEKFMLVTQLEKYYVKNKTYLPGNKASGKISLIEFHKNSNRRNKLNKGKCICLNAISNSSLNMKAKMIFLSWDGTLFKGKYIFS